MTADEDEYVKPPMLESRVGEEASMDEAIEELLVAMVVFVLSATVSAATMDGSLLVAEDDVATASAIK